MNTIWTIKALNVHFINICLVCVCNNIINLTDCEVKSNYERAIYERTDLLNLFIGRRRILNIHLLFQIF